jgi:hypothetical protein
MKKSNTTETPITEDMFFNDMSIKNKKIVELEMIMDELQDKIDDLGLPVNFVKNNLK